jgi:hypothetical protein
MMSNLAIPRGRLIKFQLTSAPIALTLARGAQFGLANASKELAETLVVRFPR